MPAPYQTKERPPSTPRSHSRTIPHLQYPEHSIFFYWIAACISGLTDPHREVGMDHSPLLVHPDYVLGSTGMVKKYEYFLRKTSLCTSTSTEDDSMAQLATLSNAFLLQMPPDSKLMSVPSITTKHIRPPSRLSHNDSTSMNSCVPVISTYR
ncbi:vacuolar protein sorting-associated protein 36 [Moniliophthora roreri]|nr:vacuolar protein sorting-associated protein 36 [Moniliophthora roreri]